jgi:hypothetical protein
MCVAEMEVTGTVDGVKEGELLLIAVYASEMMQRLMHPATILLFKGKIVEFWRLKYYNFRI